jgi:hypothetical protein
MEGISESVIGPFMEAGLLGVIILALGLYIIKRDRDHRIERKEMFDLVGKQHTEAMEVTKGNMTVLAEMKTLIQTIVHR